MSLSLAEMNGRKHTDTFCSITGQKQANDVKPGGTNSLTPGYCSKPRNQRRPHAAVNQAEIIYPLFVHQSSKSILDATIQNPLSVRCSEESGEPRRDAALLSDGLHGARSENRPAYTISHAVYELGIGKRADMKNGCLHICSYRTHSRCV